MAPHARAAWRNMALTRSSEKLEDLLPSACGAGRSLCKQQTERGTKEDRGWGASGRPSEEKRRSKVLFWLVPLLLPPLSSLRRSQWGRSISSRTGQTPTPEKVEELPSPTWKWCWWPYMGTTTHYSEHGLEWSKGKRRGGGNLTHWSPQRELLRRLILLWLSEALSPICETTQNSGRRRPNGGVVALEGTTCISGKEHSDKEHPSLPGTPGEGAERINSTERRLNQGELNLLWRCFFYSKMVFFHHWPSALQFGLKLQWLTSLMA